MKNSRISATIAGPTAIQLAWKKDAKNPSGPDALSGWIAKMVFLISLSDGIAVRERFKSSVIPDLKGEQQGSFILFFQVWANNKEYNSFP